MKWIIKNNEKEIMKKQLAIDIVDAQLIIAALKVFNEFHIANADRASIILGEDRFEKTYSDISKRNAKLIKQFEKYIS